jgi:hypothetical protein
MNVPSATFDLPSRVGQESPKFAFHQQSMATMAAEINQKLGL